MATLPPYVRAVIDAVRAAEVGGRLPSPTAEELGDIFPYEAPVQVVPVADPALPEPARSGEKAEECVACTAPDEAYLWTSVRWRLRALHHGIHVFLLEPRQHADLTDLDADTLSEMGRLLAGVDEAIRAGIDGVERVHVNRWGDGAAHLHWWFLARPSGLLQLRGSALPMWLDVLPRLPREDWYAGLDAVEAHLRHHLNPIVGW